MSIFPQVRKVQALIVGTFDVSEEQALEYAAEMVSLAEGWGDAETAQWLDWGYRIRKDLGEARGLPWRSQADREKFEAAEKQKYAEWDAIIRTKNRG